MCVCIRMCIYNTYYYIYYIGSRILLSPKIEWNNAICSNMDGPRGYHTKWSQTKTNITWYCLYVESKKKNDTDELIHKIEIDLQT